VIAFLPIAAFFLFGCGHTNNLAKYNVRSQSYFFQQGMSYGAASVNASLNSVDTSAAAQAQTSITSSITNSQLQSKLARAAHPDQLESFLSRGMEYAVKTYLNASSASSVGNTSFIVETQLKTYQLSSSATSVSAAVSGCSRIIERKSGAVVWEDCETKNIPLHNVQVVGGDAAGAVASIANAAELLAMSDEDVRQVINQAAQEAGRQIGETLREDVANMNAKK
ncbi:MAG TPA: hypothetical protein VFJ29_03925, partial [Candidatus Kapabacteria bacterium]|nr:hypothetical protein [Candidatus Kapabacteria bacterium]